MIKKVLLASMPWPNYNMPSIQVAVLKAYLLEKGIPCEGSHWYAEIADYLTFKEYDIISSTNAEGGEAIYSYLFFEKERNNLIRKNGFIRSLLENNPNFFSDLDNFHQKILDRYDWSQYILVGLTLNFAQTISSLYISREIKKRNPNCKIIFGGAEATSELGKSLVQEFNEIDFACNGEGESVLVNLYELLKIPNKHYDFSTIKGLIYTNSENSAEVNSPDQLNTMELLPTPNFDEYFDFLTNHKTSSPYDLSVVIPIETSRGCYYDCSFCSLNIQWIKTRNQSPNKVSEMMSSLSDKFKILDFFVVDNITPTNVKLIFERVLKDGRDYRFFYEMRANIPLDNLIALKNAGLKRVQIGIEAMSTSLLDKFNKKCKTIHNIQGMKNCEELGIIVSSNFIINHPRTDENDIKETLHNIEFCYHLRPPNAFSEFGLIYGSPDYNEPTEDFEMEGNHKMYYDYLPKNLANNLTLPLKHFNNLTPQISWDTVKRKVDSWTELYKNKIGSLLFMQDGGNFMKIEDRRYGELEVYILDETERKIYLFINQVKPLSKIQSQFPEVEKNTVKDILEDLVSLKLVYTEDQKYLGLALKT